ncbi:MAG: amidohydrolase family protein [Gemmatimonadetes bacterium]|nr:amidohydrolase family protein [Gemmatimonadota bacterium]MYB62292.1 amidohydrolase family protein [Gemmatimonadota bacterium]
MIIDVNAWTGPWPALVNVPYDVDSVRSSLRTFGVERIFMSPLAAAWSANPHLCNRVVYEAADAYADISPVPVIDPTLPTWPEELAKATGHRAVPMIKLLPGYGRYGLDAANDLFEEAGRASLAVMVQIRIDDPRRHHPLAQVPDVHAGEVMETAKRHPDLKLVLGGASASTLREYAPQVRDLPGLYADTSQVDGVDSVKTLVDEGIGGKLLFGSHAPVFMPAAALARVLCDFTEESVMDILRKNTLSMFVD